MKMNILLLKCAILKIFFFHMSIIMSSWGINLRTWLWTLCFRFFLFIRKCRWQIYVCWLSVWIWRHIGKLTINFGILIRSIRYCTHTLKSLCRCIIIIILILAFASIFYINLILRTKRKSFFILNHFFILYLINFINRFTYIYIIIRFFYI